VELPVWGQGALGSSKNIHHQEDIINVSRDGNGGARLKEFKSLEKYVQNPKNQGARSITGFVPPGSIVKGKISDARHEPKRTFLGGSRFGLV